MLVTRAIKGNINDANFHQGSRLIDPFHLEWFDTTKRIIRGFSEGGRELGFKNFSAEALLEGDVLYEDEEICIVVKILPCSCIIFKPQNMKDMAVACFEIGNKHVPIFINSENEIITAFEDPLYNLLQRAGFQPKVENRVIEKTDVLMIHNYSKNKNKIVLIKEE
ncbi:urease accessory protein UreE [Sphingobacterium daejeonense]|uniref:urease accessory protein UreE n=1 Tax=Sphingobacterium daejeonense TaxID=371142 RepID=UPI0021A8FFCB|nr:urease accessory protein UreE [Sphingobacterium daejeonense]MCT1531651.1 urease accessory protein UreE [Sphingobacterium daejeonense]